MHSRDEVLRKSTPADEKEVRAVVPRYESRSGRLLGEQETQLARRSARGATEGRSLQMSTLVDEKGHGQFRGTRTRREARSRRPEHGFG